MAQPTAPEETGRLTSNFAFARAASGHAVVQTDSSEPSTAQGKRLLGGHLAFPRRRGQQSRWPAKPVLLARCGRHPPGKKPGAISFSLELGFFILFYFIFPLTAVH